MLYVLEKWIAMRTVSGNPKYMEECRRGARFLKNILQQLGAVSRMVSFFFIFLFTVNKLKRIDVDSWCLRS